MRVCSCDWYLRAPVGPSEQIVQRYPVPLVRIYVGACQAEEDAAGASALIDLFEATLQCLSLVKLACWLQAPESLSRREEAFHREVLHVLSHKVSSGSWRRLLRSLDQRLAREGRSAQRRPRSISVQRLDAHVQMAAALGRSLPNAPPTLDRLLDQLIEFRNSARHGGRIATDPARLGSLRGPLRAVVEDLLLSLPELAALRVVGTVVSDVCASDREMVLASGPNESPEQAVRLSPLLLVEGEDVFFLDGVQRRKGAVRLRYRCPYDATRIPSDTGVAAQSLSGLAPFLFDRRLWLECLRNPVGELEDHVGPADDDAGGNSIVFRFSVADFLRIGPNAQKLVLDAIAEIALDLVGEYQQRCDCRPLYRQLGDGGCIVMPQGGDPASKLVRDFIAQVGRAASSGDKPFHMHYAVHMGAVMLHRSVGGRLLLLGEGVNAASEVLEFAGTDRLVATRRFVEQDTGSIFTFERMELEPGQPWDGVEIFNAHAPGVGVPLSCTLSPSPHPNVARLLEQERAKASSAAGGVRFQLGQPVSDPKSALAFTDMRDLRRKRAYRIGDAIAGYLLPTQPVFCRILHFSPPSGRVTRVYPPRGMDDVRLSQGVWHTVVNGTATAPPGRKLFLALLARQAGDLVECDALLGDCAGHHLEDNDWMTNLISMLQRTVGTLTTIAEHYVVLD